VPLTGVTALLGSGNLSTSLSGESESESGSESETETGTEDGLIAQGVSSATADEACPEAWLLLMGLCAMAVVVLRKRGRTANGGCTMPEKRL